MGNIILTAFAIGFLCLVGLIFIAGVYIAVSHIVNWKTPRKRSRKHLRVIK